jgi:hypothetical protein
MITERATLAAVHISIWTAVKDHRKVIRQAADELGAPESAGRYNKKLLSGAARLDDLRSLTGQIRQSFYKITLPWSDEGFDELTHALKIRCHLRQSQRVEEELCVNC